jgi:Uma2 family endonuclease
VLSHSTVRPNQAQLDDLLLRVLPDQGHWSDDDYLWLTDHTNQLIEITDGFLEVLPVPTDEHQTLLLFLYEIIQSWVRGVGGKVLIAPFRLRVRERKFREPDLLVLRDAKDSRRSNRYWTGADLVVEVLSPDKPSRDLVDKRSDYADAEIPEYWIVDPESETVLVLNLVEGAYREEMRSGRGQEVISQALPGLKLSVTDLFDAD